MFLSSFQHKTFCCAPERLKFKLLLPGTVSLYTWYQRWLIRQSLLISTTLPTPASFLPWYAVPLNSHIQKQIIPG